MSGRPPARLPRVYQREFVLLRRSREPFTREDLHARVEASIRDCLAAVCLWDDSWQIGDYRFLVLSVDLGGGVVMFAQFWSEPQEPVRWEMSSGHWSPEATAYVRSGPGAWISARGFVLEPNGNYAKDIDVPDEAAVASLAREVVDLFYDAFGYRGRRRLEARIASASRAIPAWVYIALTPDDLVKILNTAGFKARVRREDEDAALATVAVRWSGIKGIVLMSDQPEGQQVYTLLELGPDVDVLRHEGLSLSDEVDILTIPLNGGVTAEWLVGQLAMWFKRQQATKQARQAKKAAKSIPPSERLH